MSKYIDAVQKGSHIEWRSDKHLDRGPCTGRVIWMLDGLYCVEFGKDDYAHFRAEDLPIVRVSKHHRTGAALFFID